MKGKKIMQKLFFYIQGFADKSFKRSERKMTLVIKGILLYIYFYSKRVPIEKSIRVSYLQAKP